MFQKLIKNKYIILLYFSLNSSFSQNHTVIIYDLNFKHITEYSYVNDSVNFSQSNYLKFNKEKYFTKFEGCYFRILLDSTKRTLNLEDINKMESMKIFENKYLIGEPFPKFNLDSDRLNSNLPDGKWIKVDCNFNKIYEININHSLLDGFVYIFYKNNQPKLISQFYKGTYLNYILSFHPNGYLRAFMTNNDANQNEIKERYEILSNLYVDEKGEIINFEFWDMQLINKLINKW